MTNLVLNEWIIPAISDQNAGKRDLLCAGDILRVLLLDIFVVDRPIMPAVRLGCEVELLARVLRECAHETLQRRPEVRRTLRSAGRCQGLVGVRVCAAAEALGPVWAKVPFQRHDQLGNWIGICRHRDVVRQAGLGRLVNEKHVRCVRPGVRIVVGIEINVNEAWSILLEEAYLN